MDIDLKLRPSALVVILRILALIIIVVSYALLIMAIMGVGLPDLLNDLLGTGVN